MGRRCGRALVAVGLVGVWGSACNEGDTITAPALSATCSATPSEGSAPLEVAFTLGVSGAEGSLSVQVSYGDGSTGSDPDAQHTYEEAGLYTASFTVTTPTQSARCATTLEVGPGAATATEEDSDGNLPPVITYKTTPNAKDNRIDGTAPLKVRFNICLTHDPEGDTLYFVMDLNNDGKLDEVGTTGGSCRGDWTYAVGTWTAKVCVTDLDDEGARLHPMECRRYKVVAK
jgi:PKD repeat protein